MFSSAKGFIFWFLNSRALISEKKGFIFQKSKFEAFSDIKSLVLSVKKDFFSKK